MRSLPESRRPGAPHIDIAGFGLSILALASTVFALIEGVDAGWTDAGVLAAALVGLVAGIAFVLVELRRREPLFDVSLLARPAVAAGAVVLLTIYIAFLGVLFLLPQYLHYVRHQSILLTGLSLAPMGVGTLIAAPLYARLVARLGARTTLVSGLTVMSGSVALLLLLHRTSGVLLVLLSMTLLGAMIPLTATPATGVVMADVGEEKAGDGGAINQLARQVGAALGVAIVGSVFAEVYAHRIAEQLVGFPHAARARAGQSIEAAQTVIAGSRSALHADLSARIAHTFDVAARTAFAVIVALLLAAAVTVAWGLAGRRRRARLVSAG